MKRPTLVIGDLHCPAMHSSYVAFLKKIYKREKCGPVILIGDVVDWACISYHEKDPDYLSPAQEVILARKQIAKIYKAFPRADWLIGNHDDLPKRQMKTAGLPGDLPKDPADYWNVPGWKTVERFGHIWRDGVMYQHGDRGRGGMYCAAYLNAQDEHRSVVQGHFHGQFGVLWFANQSSMIYGMQVGCGVDHDVAAMKYGRKFNRKPIVGCGVVYDQSRAAVFPMKMGGR